MFRRHTRPSPLVPLLAPLLSLFLLLAVQGSALHALGHVAQALGTTQQAPASDTHPAGDQPCSLCLAFAAFGAALPSSASALVPPADFGAPSTTADGALPCGAPACYRARAPPLLVA